MTATERAREINSWDKDSSFKLVEDAAHWAEIGITTAEELDRYLAISSHSDVFKDVYGYRPRHFNYDLYTTEKIESMTSDLYAELDRQMKQEREAAQREADALKLVTDSTPLKHNPFAALLGRK